MAASLPRLCTNFGIISSWNQTSFETFDQEVTSQTDLLLRSSCLHTNWIMAPFLCATGIGVANMEQNVKFYKETLNIGLAPTQTFDVEAFTETVLGFPRG